MRHPASILLLLLVWATPLGLARAEEEPAEPAAPAKQAKVRHPLLWEAWNAEKSSLVYLFGTVHSSQPDVTTLLPEVEQALDRSDALYAELDMSATGQLAIQQALPKYALGGASYSLKQAMGEDLYGRFRDLLTPAFQGALPRIDGFKPWFAALILQQSELARLQQAQGVLPTAEALDAVLYKRAQRAKKVVGGLETPDEQFRAFDCIDNAGHLELLRVAVEQIEKQRAADAPTELERLIRHWLTGDFEKLEAVVMEAFAGAGEALQPTLDTYRKALLDDRNVTMAVRTLERVDKAGPGKTIMVAVGAAHMMGDTGLLKLLAAKGYKVKRILTGTALAPKPAVKEPAKAGAGTGG